MRLFVPLILLAPALLIASCSGSRKASRNVMLDPLTISSSNSEYRASATMHWDITHTDVALSFNLQEKTANGKAVLDMQPYFYSSNTIVLDAKSMKINSVQVNGEKAKVNYNNDSLTIYLDREYHRTENIQVAIDYVAMPYAAPSGGSKAIRDDRGLYFINTDYSIPGKPTQIWTQGETQATSHWVPTFDRPNERFTTRVQLTVPDSFTTLSNGQPGTAVFHEDGTRTDVWAMDQEIQPYVMMLAIGKYEIVADEQWRGKDVLYYVEPEFGPYAKDMFKHTPEMIEFFSDVTGVPYPWNKYSQVVVRDYVSGAMENTTATLFGEFMNQTSRETADHSYEDVVSHELFHQWFGDYVTAESWSNLTLNESFATYGEQLWRRYKYGKASEQKLALDDFYAYMNQAKNNDAELVRFHYHEREDMFDRISYQKGATILHYLHGLMGDTAFYHAMQLYLETNALQPAEVHHWRLAVEEVTGKDWNWFFNQWYYRGGHPVLDVNYEFDDTRKQVKIMLSQKQAEFYRLPLKLDIVTGTQTAREDIDMDVRDMTVTYPYPDTTRPAIFPDAEHWLVGRLNDNKTPEHWLKCFRLAGEENYRAKIAALDATKTKLNTATVQELYRLALADNLEYVRVFALEVLQGQKSNTVQRLYKADVSFLVLQDVSRYVRAAALDVAGEWKITESERDMYVALGDDSYLVSAAALRALGSIRKDTVYTIAKQLINTQPGIALREQLWNTISTEALAADTAQIQEHKYRISGREKISFSASMATYMKNTPSDTAFAVALETVEYLVLSENIAPYRANMASYLFNVAYFFKDEAAGGAGTKSADAKAENRLKMLRKTLTNLREKETDEDNIATYKKYLADVYKQ